MYAPEAGKTADTSVPWHTDKLEQLQPGTREVLENYSKIPAEQVLPHVHRIRDKAWKVYPYPCIGSFRFTDLSLGLAPQYQEVLQRVKGGQRLLDMGCCFAQDIRRLVYDGAPSANLYGSDLVPAFFDLGYELFKDKETLSAHLFAADIFADNADLTALDGSVDIIHASSFFHLFDQEPQVNVARRFVKLLKPAPGSLILGRHMGDTVSKQYQGMRPEQVMFRHNPESWKKMWDELGEETGTKWRVEVAWDDWRTVGYGDKHWQSETAKPMRYAVWRE